MADQTGSALGSVVRHSIISEDTLRAIHSADRKGLILRQIARLTVKSSQATARVALEAVPLDSFLGGCVGAENRVEIHWGSETVRLRGQGAGPWPTAAAVMGDLLTLRRKSLNTTTGRTRELHHES